MKSGQAELAPVSVVAYKPKSLTDDDIDTLNEIERTEGKEVAKRLKGEKKADKSDR